MNTFLNVNYFDMLLISIHLFIDQETISVFTELSDSRDL